MKMKLLSTCTCLLCAAILAGCTSETEQVGASTEGPGTNPNNDANRREITLVLKNDLALRTAQPTKSGSATASATETAGVTTDQLTTKANPATTKADGPIATADENLISSLDVYVFASATETGEYTFQERFAYRADATASLPAGATELKLTAAGGDTKETTGLLKLKKGLFVKLYCMANASKLIGPDGNEVADASFTPLVFTEDGKGVQTEGQPKESVFISYHTPLLVATESKDVLTTPLAMSGAYTTPLDLTDFESSARMQASFKLTRLAARFDIINNAETSKFTIESVSMGKGRRGATFFPIRIYGDMPTAQDGELITYPERAFDGDNANIGIQTGAFYSYPSPKEDEAYLILKGTYQVNKTESKEVTYQVPFRTSSASGDGSYLEINNNHRYTLAITEADDYHLDFTLNVADWADDGSINDYTPGTDTGAIDIKIPAGDTETKYDADSRTVTMSLTAGTSFDMVMEKTSPILPAMTKTYAGGLAAQEYDWLTITPPPTTASAPLTKAGRSDAAAGDAAADGYKYTFALNPDYTKNRYPRAIVRFKNLTNGEETVLFVDALEPPKALTTIQDGKTNPNTFDPDALEAELYCLANSNLRIKLFCTAGVELGGYPAWLTATLLSEKEGESLYSFTLNDVNAAPTDNKGTIVFKNAKYPDKRVSVTVNLLVADIAPDFSQLGGDVNNSFDPASDVTPANVTMRIAEDNTFKFTSASPKGVQIDMDFAGGPQWLSHTGEAVTKASSFTNDITFSLVKENLLGAKKATITLKNKGVNGLENYVFTVTPDFVEPELTSSATMTLESKADKNVPSIQITGNSFGGSRIVTDESPEWLTYETTSTEANTFTYKVSLIPGADKTNFPTSLPDNQRITVASAINPDKKTTVTVSFRDQGWVEESINADEDYANGSNPTTEYRVKTVGKTLTLTAYSMFATPTVETGYDSNYGTSNTGWLPSPTSPTTSGYGENRQKFTYNIVVPPTSGTAPDVYYHLHKGTLTVKQGSSELKKLTVWRGASNIPYPSGRSDHAYYSAVKKGGSWFAPLNLGATQIATNATDVANAGNLYQWGRNVPTTYGSTTKITGPVDADSSAEFITSSGGHWDWLKVQNDNLWGSSKTSKDPCPAGWRVPTKDELAKWGSGTWSSPILTIPGENGINLVLPAAGRRNGNGDSSYQGTGGYYWSSSPSGTNSSNVDFSGSTATVDTRNRVYAFSVRCVQE